MSEEPGVYLSASCLLSKWGFGDGDEPDHYLDWLDQMGLPYPDDWHGTLRTLVRERLMPLLADRDVRLVDVQTIHNPIRAATVDGKEVDWYHDHEGQLSDAAIVVPYPEVYETQTRVSLR